MQSMPDRPKTSKVLLVKDARAAHLPTPDASVAPQPIRRFRIARVRPENRVVSAGQAFERTAA